MAKQQYLNGSLYFRDCSSYPITFLVSRALCVVWTTPLVATLGMSLTIPLAMVADMVIHGRHYSAIYMLGSAQVLTSSLVKCTTNCTLM